MKYSLVEILSQLGGISAIAAILWVILRFMKGKAFEVMQWLFVALAVMILLHYGIYICKYALG